jgi:hypothetical protein
MASKTLLYTCDNCDERYTVCKKCNVLKPATREYFYTTHGKLKLSSCKECKKEYVRNRKPTKKYVRKYDKENKRLYDKKYYERKKMEKLNAKKQL